MESASAVAGQPPCAPAPEPERPPLPRDASISNDPGAWDAETNPHGCLDPAWLADDPQGVSSKAYEVLKRFSRGAPAALANGFTHICVAVLKDGKCCNQRFRLPIHKIASAKRPKDDPIYVTSNAQKHIAQKHPDTAYAQESAARSKVKQQKAEMVMHHVGQLRAAEAEGTSKLKQSQLCAGLTWEQKCMAAQALHYIYSKRQIHKSELKTKHFKYMIRVAAQLPAGAKVPIITDTGLQQFRQGEFDSLFTFIRVLIELKVIEAKGNVFSMLVHDGGTLTNKRTYLAIGLQFVAPGFEKNIIVCIGMVRIVDSTNTNMAAVVEKVIEERLGKKARDILARSRQDRKALGVASELDLDRDACMMHDNDKLAASACGDLVRSKNKKPVNAFPEGQQLLDIAHKGAVHFSYGNRADELKAIGKANNVRSRAAHTALGRPQPACLCADQFMPIHSAPCCVTYARRARRRLPSSSPWTSTRLALPPGTRSSTRSSA